MWAFSTHKTFSFVQQFDWIIITKLNFALHLDRFNLKLNFKVTFIGDITLAINCLEWLKTRIDLKVRKSNFIESESQIARWKKGRINLNQIWKTHVEYVPFRQRRISRSTRQLARQAGRNRRLNPVLRCSENSLYMTMCYISMYSVFISDY
jgi:hypothetical protein